jgi:hypothetical protein
MAGPYYMLGSEGSNVIGMTFAPGLYTLKIAGDDVERAKTVKFTATDKC